jgi:predicted nuclease of predicted toxin-antitoxin system
MKFIIDEDLSPRVARYLCQEFCLDAIAVRDRNLLVSRNKNSYTAFSGRDNYNSKDERLSHYTLNEIFR